MKEKERDRNIASDGVERLIETKKNRERQRQRDREIERVRERDRKIEINRERERDAIHIIYM